MKKILPVLMTAAMVSTLAAPRDSYAGLAIGASKGHAGAGALIGLGAGVTGALIWGLSLGAFEDEAGTLLFGVFLAPSAILAGTLLDATSGSSVDQFAASFRIKYPFVESGEAVNRIAESAREKAIAAARVHPEASAVHVSFTTEELTALLADTSVSAEDFRFLAQELN